MTTTARRVTALEWELWLRTAVSRLEPEYREKALEAGRKVKPGAILKAHVAILRTLPDADLRAIILALEEDLARARA